MCQELASALILIFDVNLWVNVGYKCRSEHTLYDLGFRGHRFKLWVWPLCFPGDGGGGGVRLFISTLPRST